MVIKRIWIKLELSRTDWVTSFLGQKTHSSTISNMSRQSSFIIFFFKKRQANKHEQKIVLSMKSSEFERSIGCVRLSNFLWVRLRSIAEQLNSTHELSSILVRLSSIESSCCRESSHSRTHALHACRKLKKLKSLLKSYLTAIKSSRL